jgi:hypothetical protein
LLGRAKLSHEVAEVAIGLQGFQAAVEVYGGLESFVTQNAADRFVVSRFVLKPDRRSSVSELVGGDKETGGFFDPFGNLIAQGLGVLAAARLAWK